MAVLRLHLLIVVTFLSSASALWSQSDEAARNLMGEAQTKLRDGQTYDRREAERLIRKALELWREDPTQNREVYADASVVLALLLLGDRKLSESRLLAKEGLRVYEQVSPGAENSKVALALDALIGVHLLSRATKEAEPLQQRANAIRTRLIQEKQKMDDAGKAPMGTPMKIEGTVKKPSLRKKAEPGYSDAARLAKRQGTVLFSVVIDTDGTTRNITLLRSLGFELDEAAYQAVRSWKFQPGTLNDQPVPVIAKVEVNFRLL